VINSNSLAQFPSYCRLLVIFALSTGVPLFNTLVRDDHLNSRPRNLASKTRNIALLYGENCVSISWTV